MRSLLWGRLRRTWQRTAALGLGLLVASTSFVFLTADVQQSTLAVKGKVNGSIRSAYDVLVRPQGATTGLEKSRGLVQPNYLSGQFGGITLAQYQGIRKMPGVQIAAPIANIGYTFVEEPISVDLGPVLTNAPYQLFKVSPTWTTDRGTSTFPGGVHYVYVTHDKIVEESKTSPYVDVDPETGQQYPVFDAFPSLVTSDVFSPGPRSSLDAFSTTSPNPQYDGSPAQGHIQATIEIEIPVLLAAIDPQEEAALDGLSSTIESGRYLTESDAATVRKVYSGSYPLRAVPVIAASQTFADQSLSWTVQRLDVPDPTGLPARLAASNVRSYVAGLQGPSVASGQATAQTEWAKFARLATGGSAGTVQAQNFWTVGPTTYAASPDGLTPRQVTNSQTVWLNQAGGFLPPIEDSDTAFRTITNHQGSNDFHQGVNDTPVEYVVGTYDASNLQGFSPLSQVPLSTFEPPAVAPGNAPSRAALDGQDLGPNANLAGYVAQPPLLLTTLKALPAFSSQYFTDTDSTAPISAIRIRVAGVTGTDAVSRERIRRVAQEVAKTGLDVDITYGSSPAPQTILLPAGTHGRPALTLSEGWVKKGVAIALLRGVDRKSAVLFVLVLVVCAVFLFNATDAAVTDRRPEFALLSCLGWSRGRLIRLVLGELAAVGLAAGLLGAGIIAAASGLGLVSMAWLRLALVLPLSVVLALLAGLAPTLSVRVDRPLAQLTATPRMRGRVRGHVRSLARLAARNVARRPRRALLGAGAMGLGVFALTTLVAVSQAFNNGAAGSLLGGAVVNQARPADYAAAALTLVLGAGAVADVVYLGILERRAELATLTALGWTAGRVRGLLAAEGLLTALTGAVVGAIGGILVGTLAEHVSVGLLIGVAAGMLAISLAATGIAVAVPLRRLTGISVRTDLAST